MKNTGLSGLLMFLLSFVATAQQDPNTYLNPYFNPALVIGDHRLNVEVNRLMFENESMSWVNASFEMRPPSFGLGVSYRRLDSKTYLNDFARLNLAYRFKIGEHSVIPGMYFGFKAFTNALARADVNSSSNFPEQTFIPDIGLGVSYRYRHLLFAVSASDLNTGYWVYGKGISERAVIAAILHSVISYDAAIGKYFRIKPVTIFTWTSSMNVNRFFLGDHLVLGVDNISKVLTRINTGIGLQMFGKDASGRITEELVISSQLCFKWFTMGYSTEIPMPSSNQELIHQFSFRIHLFPNNTDVAIVPQVTGEAFE